MRECSSDARQITAWLQQLRSGNEAVAEELFDAVYSELRRRARGCMSGERASHTLQPTALVHEAYVRIFEGAAVDWQNRAHFFAIAARQMRRVLVDHGREHRAAKRGFGLKVSLEDQAVTAPAVDFEVEGLETLLERLQRTDAEAYRVVELKFFSSMTDQEVADVLGVSHSTVRRHWKFAKAWLLERMGGSKNASRGKV